jgi:hypothetical protein
MISGHVHSYERFDRAGKSFLVAGGGGGPRVRLREGSRRRHTDDAFDGPALRWFHYLFLRLDGEGLDVEARGLEKSGRDCVSMDRFRLGWIERR